MTVDPLHLLVVELADESQAPAVRRALEEAARPPALRLVELAFVRRNGRGALERWTEEEPPGREEAGREDGDGAIAGGLMGLGAAASGASLSGAVLLPATGAGLAPRHLRDMLGRIPPGACAALAVYEHRWVGPLRDALARTGAFVRGQGTVDADGLTALGAVLAGETGAGGRLEA